MYSRKMYPSIEEELVRRAICNLRHLSREQTHSPLEQLLLIDLMMLDVDSPYSPHSREFALQHLLVNVITECLTAHRVKFALSTPHEFDSVQTAESAVRLDGRNGNIDLLGWSWLYYGYVRSDLNFTQEFFADIVCVDTRTVRRYQHYAINNLTDRLIDREWQARKSHRRQQLRTRLPAARPIRLIGREAEFAHAHHVFDQLKWNHLQVIGESGVGKTVFVQEFLRKRIELEVFDAIVWVDNPCSVDAVRVHLADQFALERQRAMLREYLTMHRIAVVIDGAGHLEHDIEALRILLDDLSEAALVLIHRSRLPLANLPACIQLRQLEQPQAFTLIQRLAEAQFRGPDGKFSDDELWYVWNMAGGNPSAIYEGIHAIQCETISVN